MNPKVKEIAERAIRSGVYKKNIHYLYEPGARTSELALAQILGGTAGQSGWIIQQVQMAYGKQLHVSKQVSDDLLATDFTEASKIENVPWPATSVEVYFEDPLLPTILVMKSSPDELEKLLRLDLSELKSEEYITALMQAGNDVWGDTQLNLQLNPPLYETFLNEGEVPPMNQDAVFSSALNEQDNFTLCYMLHLALKVFVFSSIPTYKPISIGRKQMSHGGKPGVKKRPDRPAVRVDYLPKVIQERRLSIPSDESHTFKGRRGHIRYYKSDVFVNRKGTWDFLPPVANPHTGKYPERSVIRVRKPN
jgi:hypothetical protein